MSDAEQPQQIELDGWPFRVQQPSESPSRARLMLVLHGYLGNENVMWVLTKPIPKSYILLAPRAPVQLGPDQYSWHAIAPQWPDMDTYRPLGEALLQRVDHWVKTQGLTIPQYDVMGFSQGAVMALALSILYPERIRKAALLAGFLPQSWKAQLPAAPDALADKAFFIAHGTQDEVVPIAKAHQAAEWLKEKGADVTFCEADTGHKLSANCFNGLGVFFD